MRLEKKRERREAASRERSVMSDGREGKSERERIRNEVTRRARRTGGVSVISLKLEGRHCDLRFGGNLQLARLSRAFCRALAQRRAISASRGGTTRN
jgi:hypothetical protein